MTNAKFQTLCKQAFNRFVKLVPNSKTRGEPGGSTGNMAFNASKIEFPAPDTCIIYVDPDIAPYLPYTNEPWVAARWHGKKNPNEGWFQKAAENIVNYVLKRTKGELRKNDSNRKTNGTNK